MAKFKPLPKHTLEQSPCYTIIGTYDKYRVPFYYCRLHPKIENIYSETIEHHCKSEILKVGKEILLNYTAKKKTIKRRRVGDL